MTHLKQLEQESIHIMREVVAEFKNPVMLYSVGKDSAVMLRLAQKAFHPGKFPFPLMHIDTGYKFPEIGMKSMNMFCSFSFRQIFFSPVVIELSKICSGIDFLKICKWFVRIEFIIAKIILL